MASNAERQRRYRKHRAGDHSLCLPENCSGSSAPAAASTPPGVSVPPRPVEPSTRRGDQLWADMEGAELGPAHRVLLREACRIADRLDDLDALLTGRADRWLHLNVDEDNGQVIVVVDQLLGEARQHATALRGLVSELRQAVPAPKKGSVKPDASKGGGLSDLSARIADRRRASAR